MEVRGCSSGGLTHREKKEETKNAKDTEAIRNMKYHKNTRPLSECTHSLIHL
jgi:hypothetical protein